MNDVLRAARERLENVTPLKKDCGRVCGAACCRSMEGEETGMLLFPGEETMYRHLPGWRIRTGEAGNVAICPGHCERSERPLSCRMFPLLPLLRGEEIRTVMDLRAGAVCPLARQGMNALDPAFRQAVAEAGKMLASDGETAGFLRRITEEQDEWKALKQKWRREDDL